ncbi:hypothetical protein D9619_009597 [Psilocybe cf. subviscida]|uniref:F-box domain-containing protein n=1 Tax=Psilocybe cf. subviscida TaxID=2480587 RepID=A0A8H5F6H5_9AGAR|nr:hypothetical protein D9619_009597 [Psilocybe cf. subviscida]
MASSQIELRQPQHFTDISYVVTQSSGDGPLDVSIILPDEINYNTDIPAIGELSKLVGRFRSLTIDVPYQEAWQKFVTGIGEGQAAPILESLVIKVKRDVLNRTTGPFTELSTCFTPSPALHNLQFPAWPLPATNPPQLATITSLAIITPFYGLDIPPLFAIIQAAPNLEKFTFKSLDVGDESDPNDFASQRVHLPRLTSVDVTSPGFGLDLLSNFDAPNLVDVRLDGFRGVITDDRWNLDDWGEFMTDPSYRIISTLSQRSKSIRKLELRYMYFTNPDTEFRRILSGEMLPKLEELILERTNITDEILTATRSPTIKKVDVHNCKYVTQPTA